MKKIIICLALVIALLFTACKSNVKHYGIDAKGPSYDNLKEMEDDSEIIVKVTRENHTEPVITLSEGRMVSGYTFSQVKIEELPCILESMESLLTTLRQCSLFGKKLQKNIKINKCYKTKMTSLVFENINEVILVFNTIFSLFSVFPLSKEYRLYAIQYPRQLNTFFFGLI